MTSRDFSNLVELLAKLKDISLNIFKSVWINLTETWKETELVVQVSFAFEPNISGGVCIALNVYVQLSFYVD